MQEDVSKRILAVMQHYGLRNAKFSRAIGLNNNSTVGRIVDGKSNPSFDVLYKILDVFKEIDGTWLITGRGTMLIGAQLHKAQEKQVECKECAVKQSLLEEKERTIKILLQASGMGDSFRQTAS